MVKMRFSVIVIMAVMFFSLSIESGYSTNEESPLFWPSPPARMRIAFVKSIYSESDMGVKPGFFKKLKSMLLGEEKNVLNKPIAITIDKHKTIYICDSGVPAVHVFIQEEKKYKKIIVINKETLLSPVGIAVSGNGLVFIADSKLNKVFCIDENGRYKFTIGQNKEFARPTGLAISKDRLYIVDTLAHSVLIYGLDGKFIQKFGGRGKEAAAFNFPTSITVDNQGRVYVVDTLNFRVQVFDENNTYLYSIGQPGDSSGSFSRPKGAAVDSFGHIYITDGVFDNIQIFNQKGEFLLSFGQSGQGDGEFWILSGIAIDKENCIYVADSYNQRIQIFRYVGKNDE